MIDPPTQWAALIRAQFAAQFEARGSRRAAQGVPDPRGLPTGRNEDTGGAASQGLPPGGTDAQIRQPVALRVRALSPNDPQRQQKAFRLFLESVLMQAFGRDRIDNRGFDPMVDAVLHRMEGDAELNAALREAGDLLPAEAAPAPLPVNTKQPRR